MTSLNGIDILMPSPMMDAITQKLDAAFRLQKLWEAPDPAAALAALAPNLRAIAVGPLHMTLDGAYLSQFPKLEIVANFGVGYDRIDAHWAARHGIVVTNTPDVLNEEVADTAIALTLNAVRQLPRAERHLRAGLWPAGHFKLTASLRGRTMGILGFGRIGKAIARRAESFGLKIAYHSRSAQADVAFPYYPSAVDLARAVDILVVVTPGGAATRHLVNAAVLDALGPDGVLINIARGSVVDEAALIAALQNRTILAAGLDVFENEPQVPQALIDCDNAVLLPHVGSAALHTRAAMGQLVVDNLLSWAEGKGPLTPVAETPWPAVAAKKG